MTLETLLSRAVLLALLHVHTVFPDRLLSSVCGKKSEEFGFALVGHDYKIMQTENFGRCFFECSLDERCRSVTYLWNLKECQMKTESKHTKPDHFQENPAATYMENDSPAKKGSEASVPGSSCQDILISGDAQGDGEYWIDPTASGDPFKVFCDMATDGGGWLLISRFFNKHADSLKDEIVTSNSYKTILPMYHSNNKYLLREGFNQLKQDVSFTQIRFYCFKKLTGRVLHVMTNKDDKGADVVKFFTSSDTMPLSCGSFTRLPDDNSSLAVSCEKWGSKNMKGRWGHAQSKTDLRLFRRPIVWSYTISFDFIQGDNYKCDDKDDDMSLGDIWQIFVR